MLFPFFDDCHSYSVTFDAITEICSVALLTFWFGFLLAMSAGRCGGESSTDDDAGATID